MTEEIATNYSEVGVNLQGLQSVEELARLLALCLCCILCHQVKEKRKRKREDMTAHRSGAGESFL